MDMYQMWKTITTASGIQFKPAPSRSTCTASTDKKHKWEAEKNK